MGAFVKKHLSIFSLLVAASFVLATLDTASPGEKAGNARLPSLLKKGYIGELTWWEGKNIGEYSRNWSTSHLKATGTGPAKPVPTADQDPDDVEREYYRDLENWECMYSAWSAMDGNYKTAWCEGKQDEGIGEILIVKADTRKPVQIWNGLGASDSLYKANNRAQKIRVWALQAGKAQKAIGQYDIGIAYEDITVVGSHEITLKDLNGWQPLPLPARRRPAFQSVIENGQPALKYEGSTFLAIEILSVYKGTKYNYTCISEINADKGK
ncbi:MAG TPA: hypothetical protein VLM75_06135 [Spirochaetota bacterium]|nr:hypothetical protein [Spirochaetota bacterium]